MLDPTAPLYDFDGSGQFTVEQPELECPCAGTGWLGREWLLRREPQCTCGAGDPADPSILHDVSCDCVPCPFCPLEAAPFAGRLPPEAVS
jgi:hypothetical protein